MSETRSIVEKAFEIESRAAYDYLFGLMRLRSYGYLDPKLEESVKKIAVETIIHKHLVEGLLSALKDLEKMDQSISSAEERRVRVEEVPREQRTLLRRFAERHLDIEREMIETYKRLAEKAEHPLVKKLAEALAANEEEHHRYLGELIQLLEK